MTDGADNVTPIGAAKKKRPAAGAIDRSRPVVRISTDEARVADETIAELARRDDLFQRGGFLVDVTTDVQPPAWLAHPSGAPAVRVLPGPRLRELVTDCVQLAKYDARSDGWVQAHPPSWLVQAVLARGEWRGVRPLAGVTEHPVLRADGTILDVPGYDARTGLLYSPGCEFPPVPTEPTQDDAAAAAGELLSLVKDFPFASEAHRSAWLAIPLTLAARPAIAGCVPLIFIDANAPGTGKTLLAETGVAAVTGRPLARMTQSAHDEETRKRITALAIGGEPVVLIDNVAGLLGSPALDAALTSTEWTDRLLGESRQIRTPLRLVWIATGNNATLAGDLLRRTLHVRIETTEEHPEERAGFALELPGDAIRERPRLLVAALTMLRAHAVAGQPCGGLRPWGSFEDWSRVVRGAIVFAGLPDPAETRRELAATSDTTSSAMLALLDALAEHAGYPRRMTTAELVRRLPDEPALAAALEDLIDDRVTAKRVGKLFARMRGRVFAGRAIVQAREGREGIQWTVQAITEVGS